MAPGLSLSSLEGTLKASMLHPALNVCVTLCRQKRIAATQLWTSCVRRRHALHCMPSRRPLPMYGAHPFYMTALKVVSIVAINGRVQMEIFFILRSVRADMSVSCLQARFLTGLLGVGPIVARLKRPKTLSPCAALPGICIPTQ